MGKSIWMLGGTALLLAACATPPNDAGPALTEDGFVKELPEDVLALAAPFQDLNAVRIEPADGCYYYRYTGPVETTFLPLRTRDGRPICTRGPDTPASAG